MSESIVEDTIPDGVPTQEKEWKLPQLKRNLEAAIQGFSHNAITIFIDALDECDIKEARDIVRHFTTLCDESSARTQRLRICLASRHYPNVSVSELESLQFSVEDTLGHKADIQRFIHKRLRVQSDQISHSICDELEDKAQGSFIYVRLISDILEPEIADANFFCIRSKLREIPDDLSDVYARILATDNKDPRVTVYCLQWVLFATRQLNAIELWWAVHFSLLYDRWLQRASDSRESDNSTTQRDLKELQDTFNSCGLDTITRFVISASRGLIEPCIKPHGDLEPWGTDNPWSRLHSLTTLRFIHQTVPDYLLNGDSNGKTGFEILKGGALDSDFEAQSHQYMSKICSLQIWATILVYTERHCSIGKVKKVIKPSHFQNHMTLSSYALEAVIDHAERAQRLGLSQLAFLQTFDLNEWENASKILQKVETKLEIGLGQPIRQPFRDIYAFGHRCSRGLRGILCRHNARSLLDIPQRDS